jgi:hypothetical protein
MVKTSTTRAVITRVGLITMRNSTLRAKVIHFGDAVHNVSFCNSIESAVIIIAT